MRREYTGSSTLSTIMSPNTQKSPSRQSWPTKISIAWIIVKVSICLCLDRTTDRCRAPTVNMILQAWAIVPPADSSNLCFGRSELGVLRHYATIVAGHISIRNISSSMPTVNQYDISNIPLRARHGWFCMCFCAKYPNLFKLEHSGES